MQPARDIRQPRPTTARGLEMAANWNREHPIVCASLSENRLKREAPHLHRQGKLLPADRVVNELPLYRDELGVLVTAEGCGARQVNGHRHPAAPNLPKLAVFQDRGVLACRRKADGIDAVACLNLRSLAVHQENST